MAEVVQNAAGQVKLNKICKGEDGNAEVDVYHLNEGITAQMIECKGIAPGTLVDDEEIGLWLTTRITRVRHHLQNLGWSGPYRSLNYGQAAHCPHRRANESRKTRLANARKFEISVVEGDALRIAVKTRTMHRCSRHSNNTSYRKRLPSLKLFCLVSETIALSQT